GREPLPADQRLTPPAAELPALAKVRELDQYAKNLSGAAFAPDGKALYLAHADGTLSRWSLPDLREEWSVKGEGKLKQAIHLFALGAGREGRLYAQQALARGPGLDRKRKSA